MHRPLCLGHSLISPSTLPTHHHSALRHSTALGPPPHPLLSSNPSPSTPHTSSLHFSPIHTLPTQGISNAVSLITHPSKHQPVSSVDGEDVGQHPPVPALRVAVRPLSTNQRVAMNQPLPTNQRQHDHPHRLSRAPFFLASRVLVPRTRSHVRSGLAGS